MFKGIAMVLFGGFLVLSFYLSEISEGGLFYSIWIAAFCLGSVSVGLMTLPESFAARIWRPIRSALPQTASKLAQQLEAIAKTVREEGLLALEARKKEFVDPNLRLYLKRIVEGFESKDLLPMIENQLSYRENQFREAEAFFLRYFSYLPSLGLIQSLILISRGMEQKTPMDLFQALFPFLMALALQTFFEAPLIRWLTDEREETRRYFSVLEEGIDGIQQGHHPELLGDRIRARVASGVRRVES